MKIPSRLLLLLCLSLFLSFSALAQRAATQPPEQSPGNGSDPVANELSLLRKSLQTLNARLQTIAEEILADSRKDNPAEVIKRVATNFDILTRTEERAGILRKQLIEMIEKETALKIRLTQLEEEIRPENIERSLSTVGTTRTMELRETRRRSLDSEKRGIENLLALTTQTRLRLEEDVRQADQLVQKLRQKLFPMIEKEIDKLQPDTKP